MRFGRTVSSMSFSRKAASLTDAMLLPDPQREWVAVVAKTEKDGQLVEDISSQLLAPAACSAVK